MLRTPRAEYVDAMIEASEYDRCVRCGLCLPACPTYLETMTETSGPRGRISLIKAVDEGALDVLSAGFRHQMFECLDCRACAAACPSGVQYGRLVEGARARIAQAQASRRPWLHRVGRRVAIELPFARPWVMRLCATVLRGLQKMRFERLGDRLRWFGMPQLAAAARVAPRIPARTFTARGQRYDAPSPRATVMLHAGCIMQVAFATVHEATVRVLQRNGFSVVVPSEQRCCGAIAQHAGEADFAKQLARATIAAFESSGAALCVTNAAGCGAALKEFGHLLAGDGHWEERARRFSQSVRDVLELLDAAGLRGRLGALATTVTYQEPCHLAHAQRISRAPRRLLESIPELELREMNESALCCGSAGVYNITQPEMADRLGRRKAENVVRTGAAVVATANPGCAMQVAAHLRERGGTASVRHVVELLDDAYSAAMSRS